MKKLLFIMILATTFIPISQTGASLGDMNVSYELNATETQTTVNTLNTGSILIPEKMKSESRTEKKSCIKQRLKKISSERKDRLFGLLLLAHGGQR